MPVAVFSCAMDAFLVGVLRYQVQSSDNHRGYTAYLEVFPAYICSLGRRLAVCSSHCVFFLRGVGADSQKRSFKAVANTLQWGVDVYECLQMWW